MAILRWQEWESRTDKEGQKCEPQIDPVYLSFGAFADAIAPYTGFNWRKLNMSEESIKKKEELFNLLSQR